MAHIELKNICKSFGLVDVIKDVSFEIDDKEFTVFVGPSGCGKSTLLRLVAGLEDITSGDLLLDGKVVNAQTPAQRHIAMVFQSYALYPHMNCYQNMAFGMKLAGSDKEAVDKRVRDAAEILELTPLLERLPKQLSGGQRQRVAIGRTITRDPKVFLFDEPLSNLDAALRVQMRIEIARLHEEIGATMIYVTHDQVEAMTLADKIVVLRDGIVEQIGKPLDLYHHPENLFVAGFIGSPQMNFIKSTVDKTEDDGVTVIIPGGIKVKANVEPEGLNKGDEVKLGIRPEHIKLNGNDIKAEAFVVEQTGESHFIYNKLSDGQIVVARGGGDSKHKAHDDLGLTIPSNLTHLFDKDGKAHRRLKA